MSEEKPDMELMMNEFFEADPELNKVYTYTKNRDGEDRDVYMVALRNKSGRLIGYYEKHESRIHEAFALGL